MNMKFVKKKLDLVLISALGLLFLLPSSASALGYVSTQIKPNPNYGTISITGTSSDPNTNNENFDNYGTINTEPNGIFNNYSIVNNYGIFNNDMAGTINNEGTFNNETTGTINNSWGFVNKNILNNYGTINNSVILGNEGTINNSGTINNFGLINSGTINNSGSIDAYSIENSGTINNYNMINNIFISSNSGTFNNSGTFQNDIIFYNTDDSSPGTFNNYGTLQNDGTFYNTYEGVTGTFNNEGIYQGTGTFVGDLDSGIGTIAPGNSAGTMVVEGNFFLSTEGTLEIEIGGFDDGESDLLNVFGSVNLLGDINFSFLDGYDISSDVLPGQTESFMFLYAEEGIIIDMSSVNFDFLNGPNGFVYNVYNVGNTSLWFEATNTIPVPGAFILSCIGIGCIARLRRKK